MSPPPSVEEMVQNLIDKPEEWLDTENDHLGGMKPRALLGTNKEIVPRDLLEAIKRGSFS